jgi:hypothetical protein
MAWEQRGSQTYYYRSVRRNGHVTKAYVGTGLLTALSAAEDAVRQAQRQAEAAAGRKRGFVFPIRKIGRATYHEQRHGGRFPSHNVSTPYA